MENTFIRAYSAKDISISASFIIIGLVLILLPTGAGVNIAGFFMILAGLILTVTLKTGYKDEATGERHTKREHYFSPEAKQGIAAALESRPESIDLAEADKGNAVRLDIYYSRSSGKAHLQIFEYIPYKYESCSRMYEYEISRIEKLIK